MTLHAAMNKLEKELDFLGIEWDLLIRLLEENPTMFPVSSIEAYQVYKRESL
jgi:hypothetical protein